MCSLWKKREKEETATFLRNGKSLLEQLITSFDDKRNPIGGFSAKELMIATDNYYGHQVISFEHDYYKLYKGFLQNDCRPVSVMKFEDYYSNQGCFNNIVYASKMNHKNVLKLIGCCLETEIPTLVFAPVEYGTLADRLRGPHEPHFEPLLWANRLKIAMEIANAVAYLHVGFRRPIVYKDIKPSRIVFDEQNIAKLFDFSESKFIPEGRTHIVSSLYMETKRYLAPEFCLTGFCNEKTDVFCFGMLLIELLTGKDYSLEMEIVERHIQNNSIDEIVDTVILEEWSSPGQEQQLEAFVQLISGCIKESPEDRPTMVDCAKQLRQMYQSVV